MRKPLAWGRFGALGRPLGRLLLGPLLWFACATACPAQPAAPPWAPPDLPTLEELIKEGDALPLMAPSSEPLLSLQSCLDLARQQHPALGASWAQVVQAQARYEQVWALYYPTVTLALGQATQTTIAGPLTSRQAVEAFSLDEGSNANFGITQTVFDLGRRAAQVESARASLRSVYLDFESAWVGQAQAVSAAYLQALEQDYLLAVRQADEERAGRSLEVARKFLEGGTTSLIDVAQAEIQLAAAQGSVAAARNGQRDARISLARAVGVKLEEIGSRPLEDLLRQEPEVPDFEQSLDELDTHPRLLSISAQGRSAGAAALAERRSMNPNLGLSTSLQGYRSGGFDAGVWEVQLLLTIPLYGPTVGPRVKELQAQVEEAELRWTDARLELLQGLQASYSDRLGAQQRAELALRQAKTAVLNYGLASKRYRAGLSEYTELVNALAFVSQAQAAYVEALADRASAEVDRQAATGAAARATKEYFQSKAGQKLLDDMRETDLLKKARRS